MGWKRAFLECIVASANIIASRQKRLPGRFQTIFVIRNNDIGDLLVITPLFEALHRCFPDASIVAGIGGWNHEVLENNPYVSKIISLNAPWHNNFITNQSPWKAFKYLLFSDEVKRIRAQRLDVGIDVLGSAYGSLLMMRAGIPYRLGVRGYAGGHTGASAFVNYCADEHVGRSALRFVELLGGTPLPERLPQIYLNPSELVNGANRWNQFGKRESRIVLGPGGGFPEKCWPVQNYCEIARLLSQRSDVNLVVVGGKQDIEKGRLIASVGPGIANMAGTMTLRETFALVANTDLVLCNSSMIMHVAAAFRKMSVVVLGEYFNQAEQHAVQWGYDALTIVMGKGIYSASTPSVQDVLHVINRYISHKPPGINLS